MKIRELITESEALPTYYFSYGMLCDPEYMASDATFVGIGVLQHFAFEINAFANVISAPRARVLGCLWSTTRKFIAELDKIEGYPHMYDRKTVPINCNNKRYEAEVYTMTPGIRDAYQVYAPTKTYIKSIVRGYRAAGIPLTQLRDALNTR